MLMGKRNNNSAMCGMTTLEYSMLITAIFVALLVMQVMLRRAICGKWRASADSIGFGRQYESGATTIN